MEIVGWISYKVLSYSVMPACAWAGAAVGTTVGTHVGKKIAGSALQSAKNKLSGKIAITIKKSSTYVIVAGELIEINPRKKYIIEKGKLLIISDNIYDLTDIHPLNDSIINKPSSQAEDDENWTKI